MRLSLNKKLFLSFGFMIIIVMILGVVGLYSNKQLTNISYLVDDAYYLSGFMIERENDHLKWSQDVLQAINAKNNKVDVQKDHTKCSLGLWYYSKEREDVEIKHPELKEHLALIEEPHKLLHQSIVNIENNLINTNYEAVNNIYSTATKANLGKVQLYLANIKDSLASTVSKYTLSKTSLTRTSNFIQIIAIIIAVLLGTFLSIVISLSISKPINTISKELFSSSSSLESAASQVSSSGQELSSGASELASSVEEMTSSLEELQSLIESNSKNINEGEIMMKETMQRSEVAVSQMTLLNNAHEDIRKNSKEIEKIIKVIEDIAFQTNILALNAAVEAARAGESGKGFAVVADQVKNLAEKSAEAAKRTGLLIETSIEGVNKGYELGDKVTDALNNAVNLVEKVSFLLDDVSVASKEQLKGAKQVTKAIFQINSVVQHTASSSEESAAAGEELQGQAEVTKNIAAKLDVLVTGKEFYQKLLN